MKIRQAVRATIAVIVGGVIALSFAAPQNATAQTGTGNRFKTIEIQATQYIWQLISQTSGQMICEVIIEHAGPPTNHEAAVACTQVIYATPTPLPAGTPTPTAPTAQATAIEINSYLAGSLWRFITTREFARTIQVPLPELIVNISAPSGPVAEPYVILVGYEPVLEYSIEQLFGLHNNKEFACTGSRCELPVNDESVVEFWAKSSNGDESHHVRANVRVVQQAAGYVVTVDGIIPFHEFSDSCAQTWGMSLSQPPSWAAFPQSPEPLNTNKQLHYLASQLIASGIVDASECPGRGFLNAASPNACGMEKAAQAMVTWQNQFDPVIWSAALKVGIPPRLIKTLIERESQFWPGNSRYFIYEFGLGQINQFGADVALRWDKDLYQYVCSQYLYDCSRDFASLPSYLQATLRGAMMQVINSECQTCVNGVDLFNAQQSVGIIAQTMRSNCSQVQYILDQKFAVADYEDMWKFTLVSYHSGYQCLYDAVETVKNNDETVNWSNVSSELDCTGGKAYVDDFWSALTAFDSNIVKTSQPQEPTMQPMYIPTRTPTPAPTQVLAKSSIRVVVYIDLNGNNFPDTDERVDGVIAQVFFPDGTSMAQTVSQGGAVFDMSGKVIGLPVTVSLPSLYRSFATRIAETGETLVVFKLESPQLPTAIP